MGTKPDLKEIERLLAKLSGDQLKEVDKLIAGEINKPFIPVPGPQTEALHSKADLLLYGGAAGGGKSALEVGCPALFHCESIIFRREATQLDGLINFSRDVLSGIGDFNKVDKLWTFGNGTKRLKFAGLPLADDWRKHAGNARDYMAFDEAGEFLREQVFSLLGWLRTVRDGQRCRMILGSNPPRGGDGEWMIEEFAPWLKPQNGVKAKYGELLWAIVVADKTEWVEGPGTYIRNGEEYEALSRTFIPAKLDDNPYLKDTGYRARVQALPEPLRSQLLYGDFDAGRQDHEWQVIPSQWIHQAQARWISTPPENIAMTAISCDVAQGGKDSTQIQARYGDWYGRFNSLPGKDTPDGPAVAAEVVKHMRDRCRVIVDAGGGYGGDALTQLAQAAVDCYGFKGGASSGCNSRDGMFSFRNLRAQAVWQFREALDPNYDSKIALPPDMEMVADLCAYRYEVKDFKGNLAVEIGKKDDMKERLGRSPDKGDTTIMLHSSHAPGMRRPAAGMRRDKEVKRQTQAIMRKSGHARARPVQKRRNSGRSKRKR